MTPYACHSKPRKDGYWSRHTFHDQFGDGPPVDEWRWIPDTMTRECQYRKSTPDPRCEGCTCP